jgi:ribA/ribD-fused uncharacterized protein
MTNDKESFEETLNNALKERLVELKNPEVFTFFWETKSPFSQWYKVDFTAKPLDLTATGLPSEFSQVLVFSSAEQFMMLHKALLFADYESARKIHQTRNVREQKALGRGIKGFDDSTWKKFRTAIVYHGNKLKFSQNSEIKDALFLTTGTSLVEAAPYDAVWGIGLGKEDPRAWTRETWIGSNLLGEILTYIRIEFTGKY